MPPLAACIVAGGSATVAPSIGGGAQLELFIAPVALNSPHFYPRRLREAQGGSGRLGEARGGSGRLGEAGDSRQDESNE